MKNTLLLSALFIQLSSPSFAIAQQAIRLCYRPSTDTGTSRNQRARACFTPKGPDSEIPLLSPGSVVYEDTVDIDWAAVDGATKYLITIRQGDVELWRAETTETLAEYQGLYDDTAYLLSIAALDEQNLVIAQLLHSFTADLTPISNQEEATPEEGMRVFSTTN